jgi:hypothetical protein
MAIDRDLRHTVVDAVVAIEVTGVEPVAMQIAVREAKGVDPDDPHPRRRVMADHFPLLPLFTPPPASICSPARPDRQACAVVMNPNAEGENAGAGLIDAVVAQLLT